MDDSRNVAQGLPDQRVTVITGGTRGIGAATALKLASAGHDLVLTYRVDKEEAENTASRVRATGRRAVLVRADTTREADVDRIFETATGEYATITGLVNNAGITGPIGKFLDATDETFRSVVDVNVLGYLFCAQRAARLMARSRGGSGGAIVNVSSGAATLGSPNEYVQYAAAKAAEDSMTIGLAKELGPEGIRVNAVAPGRTWTRIHADAGDPNRCEAIASVAPLGRAGEPEEIAAAIAYLIGSEASYTSGAILRVAGGL